MTTSFRVWRTPSNAFETWNLGFRRRPFKGVLRRRPAAIAEHGHREGPHGRGIRGSLPEGPRIDVAVVRGQKIEEALVIAQLHPEQWNQRPITSRRRAKTAAQQLAKVVARHITREKERMELVPERDRV